MRGVGGFLICGICEICGSLSRLPHSGCGHVPYLPAQRMTLSWMRSGRLRMESQYSSRVVFHVHDAGGHGSPSGIQWAQETRPAPLYNVRMPTVAIEHIEVDDSGTARVAGTRSRDHQHRFGYLEWAVACKSMNISALSALGQIHAATTIATTTAADRCGDRSGAGQRGLVAAELDSNPLWKSLEPRFHERRDANQ